MKFSRDWASARNSHSSSTVDHVPEDILLIGDHGLLAQWLKQDGDRYSPKTIQHYLMGLQRYIRAQKKNTFNFMEDVEFLPFRTILDTLYRKLHADGVGCSVKKTGLL